MKAKLEDIPVQTLSVSSQLLSKRRLTLRRRPQEPRCAGDQCIEGTCKKMGPSPSKLCLYWAFPPHFPLFPLSKPRVLSSRSWVDRETPDLSCTLFGKWGLIRRAYQLSRNSQYSGRTIVVSSHGNRPAGWCASKAQGR